MKTHSNTSKDRKNKLDDKKQSSQIMEDIIDDYNKIEKEDDKINIFKWRTLEDTVICNAYNDFKPGKKLLAFDLDDTLTTFEKKKGKSKDESSPYTFAFDIKKIKSKLD